MKEDIMNFLAEFHKNCRLQKASTPPSLLWFPKLRIQSFNDFKPISLISSIYKILSKVLAFRIKFTIPVVVGEIQSAFSGGKNINDGILIANEVILFYFLTGKNCPQAANEVIDGWKR